MERSEKKHMAKKVRNVPGRVNRGSRYMRRHPEEEKIIPKSSRDKQSQEVFRDAAYRSR